jgi:hypothetical protein
MNKSYCIEIESWFLNILLSQLLRIITWFILEAG